MPRVAVIIPALDEARRYLLGLSAARRHVMLLTDGETNEKLEDLKAAVDRMRDRKIGLTVVTTTGKPKLGEVFPLEKWEALDEHMKRLLAGIRDIERDSPGVLEPRPGPFQVPRFIVPWMNVTSASETAQVVASAGGAPVVAFRQSGRGRVGALALKRFDTDPGLLADALRYVVGDSPGGVSLSLEPPLIRARGASGSSVEISWQASPAGDSGTVMLEQTGSDVWEGHLPTTVPGTLFVSLGRARAAATVPSLPEYQALGVDTSAVIALASATGGRHLQVRADLDALPRPQHSTQRSGRTLFLVVALILLFTEMALSTFWKA